MESREMRNKDLQALLATYGDDLDVGTVALVGKQTVSGAFVAGKVGEERILLIEKHESEDGFQEVFAETKPEPQKPTRRRRAESRARRPRPESAAQEKPNESQPKAD